MVKVLMTIIRVAITQGVT
jgi:hypothetical protein